MTFHVGQKVKFTSPGRGYRTHKLATIVFTVPANMHPPLARFAGTHNLKNINAPNTRPQMSYLVESPGNGEKARPFLYWPHVSSLTLIGSANPPGGSTQTEATQAVSQNHAR